MIQNLRSLLTKVFIKTHERTFENRLKYLFLKNHSDTLVVVFSGFSETPRYNYIRTLKGFKFDKLFLLDDFAYRGSYYWYQNGKDFPKRLAENLVLQIVNGGGYKRVITMGSSKGGTCAIYYGLKIGATDIYAAACQYHIGEYLNTDNHQRIFKEMMGSGAGEKEQAVLDNEMPQCLQRNAGSKSKIHLFYSTVEHTYKDHTVDLISDLDKYHISHTDTTAQFATHSEVGKHFPSWIKEQLKIE